MTRTQTYQVPTSTGKTKNGIIPVPIIVNGTNTHNSGDVAKQGSVRANILGIIPFAKKLFSKKEEPAPAPRKPNPEGELVISFYDSTKELLSTETFALTKENQWETLSFSTKAEQKGYISAKIQGTSSEPAKFDDFSIQLKSVYSAKLYQENHYYPFGMNMKGLESSDKQTQQNKKEHEWQYNGKERQDDFDLFWADYHARNYDTQIGRWHAIDPHAENYFSISPYVYVANNPIHFIDPDGKDIVLTSGENTITYTPGATYKGEDDFISTMFAFLNVLNETEVGAKVVSKLHESENTFNYSNSSATNKEGKEMEGVLSFEANKNGGGTIHAAQIMNTSNISESFKNIAHESFHGYQTEFGEIGAESYVEVSAYLFGDAAQFQAMGSEINGDFIGFNENIWGHNMNSSGKKYQQAMTSLFYSDVFNQEIFDNASKNFIQGSAVNKSGANVPGKGIYKSFGSKTKKNPIISKFFPLRGF